MRTTSGPSPAAAGVAGGVDLSHFGYAQQLRRTLTTWDLLIYGLIFMVPIAPAGILGVVYQSSAGMVAAVYLVGAVAMGFTAVSYGQMLRAFPMAGSVYNYVGRGIGAHLGFLAGWLIALDYLLVPCLLSLVAATAMHAIIPAVPAFAWMGGFVLVTTVLSRRGVRLTAKATRWFLAAELAVLAIFLVCAVRALLAGEGAGLSWSSVLDPVYNPDTFSWSAVFGGVSVAMLSYLGFDAISMLAEEAKGGPRQVGAAMLAALGVAGTLFVVQSWAAALLLPDPALLIADGDPAGTAYYDAAEIAGGHWLSVLMAVATALAWGVANALVAQVATSRLLFAMARDRQLPKILARVHPIHQVPVNAVTLAGVLSLGLGLYMASRADGIPTLLSMVNFGAISGFILLHCAVTWHYLVRGRSWNLLLHLVVPVVGGGLLIAVAIHADGIARMVGLAWLGLGVLVLVALWLAGRQPSLSALSEAAS